LLQESTGDTRPALQVTRCIAQRLPGDLGGEYCALQPDFSCSLRAFGRKVGCCRHQVGCLPAVVAESERFGYGKETPCCGSFGFQYSGDFGAWQE
jgi:hypothetical protein